MRGLIIYYITEERVGRRLYDVIAPVACALRMREHLSHAAAIVPSAGADDVTIKCDDCVQRGGRHSFPHIVSLSDLLLVSASNSSVAAIWNGCSPIPMHRRRLPSPRLVGCS